MTQTPIYCLGIDASGSRCGLALVSYDTDMRLCWQTTVHAPKEPSALMLAYKTEQAIATKLLISLSNTRPLIVAAEDPSGFAYAVAQHKTSRSTNAAAVFGFPWMMAIAMLAIDAVYGAENVEATYTFQPSQWQAKLGCNGFVAVGPVREALMRVMEDRHPEKNRKHIVRAAVAETTENLNIMATKALRTGRVEWVEEQDGIDAAGIAIVGLQEHMLSLRSTTQPRKKMVGKNDR